jgi:HPt (histidine-containing phosphotransfer) domain-containing protein
MINVTPPVSDDMSGPASASPDRPIDLVHLARMTLGDRSLEREVLQLFERQTAMLVARVREGSRCAAGALAHTLKGSARGVGAGRVACAAEAVELASVSGGDGDLKSAVERLAAAADEARAVIAELLRAN